MVDTPTPTPTSTPQPSAPTISTPAELVAALKKTGQLDALRKNLWRDFEQSPDKDEFLSRVSTIISNSLERPSFKSVPRKDRQSTVLKEVETRHTHIAKAVAEVERGMKAKEKERSTEGKLGPVKKELTRILRSSRGEKGPESSEEDDDEDEPTPSAQPSPPTQSPLPASTSTLISTSTPIPSVPVPAPIPQPSPSAEPTAPAPPDPKPDVEPIKTEEPPINSSEGEIEEGNEMEVEVEPKLEEGVKNEEGLRGEEVVAKEEDGGDVKMEEGA